MIGHALNRVFVDGQWYYCDSTWNDSTNSNDYMFMKQLNWDYRDYTISAEWNN